MQVPVCGPEPEYYNNYSFGRSVSSEWWTWRQCQMEVTSQATIPKGASEGVWTPDGAPSDQNFHSTVYDFKLGDFIAENFGIICLIAILSVAIVVLSVHLFRSRDVDQPESNSGTVYLGDPDEWTSRYPS